MPRKAKSITDIRSEARKHTNTAIRCLQQIAASPKAPPGSRITAAIALLDRGYGKPAQTVEASLTVARAADYKTALATVKPAPVAQRHCNGSPTP